MRRLRLASFALASAFVFGCSTSLPPRGDGDSGGFGGIGPGSSSGTRGSGEAGEGSGALATPRLSMPAFIDLPYVLAGAGGSSIEITVKNDGEAPATGLKGAWKLAGDSSLSLVGPPDLVPAHGSAPLRFAFAGAASETIAHAMLNIEVEGQTVSAEVFGVAGDSGLGDATWATLKGPRGVMMGEGAIVAMPFAPYPDGSGTFDDPSVAVFLPNGYRERGAQDLVLHFHGFDATVAETLSAHPYREEVYESGANLVLVVPQGPVNADSGDFGKLMKPEGVANLMREVLVMLYREKKIQAPVLGELRLTSHSGGYEATATNLMAAAMAPKITSVDLFDSMYGYVSTFEDFVKAGGKIRTNYTSSGGTEADNQTFASDEMSAGASVVMTQTEAGLRDASVVDFFADSTHDGSVRVDNAYGEELRWSAKHSRNGPRLELREVTAKNGTAKVKWLSPPDEDVTGFFVFSSSDGKHWTLETQVGAGASSASFALHGGVRVQVLPAVNTIIAKLGSDVYRVDEGAKVLVVDGFDRIVDGGFGGLSHDFAALVGEAAGPVATVAHRALTEDNFALGDYQTVIWSLGDESTADHALSSAEEALITKYLANGGRLIAAGSELGFTLDQSADGQAFLKDVFGATFADDDSGSFTAAGSGPLGSVGSFSYSSAGGPYVVGYPDAFGVSGGVTVLNYANGKGASVGIAKRAAIVGFPLELVDDAAKRKAVVKALVKFVGG